MARERRCDFYCPWEGCGKAFRRRSDLRRHHRIHTNERPYRCTFKDCNKSFIQRSALTVHLRTHTGEKPHICGHIGCHKAFSDSSSLARHRRIHTGRRPYICQEPMCQRSFCRKASLTKHQCRSHPPADTNCTPSEDISPDGSYQPRAIAFHHGQYVLSQQNYYLPTSASAVYEFYSTQSIVIHKIPVASAPVDVQQYIHLAQQQSASTHPQFVSLESQPTSQAGVPPVEGRVPMVTFVHDSLYK